MKFLPLFIPENFALIHTLRVWASDKRVRIFSPACFEVGQFESKMCDIPRAVKICKLVQLTAVTRCVKLSSHHGIWEEPAKEWDVFLYRRACFTELQKTTCTEGTVLLIFKKDKVRRAHCYSLFGYNGPTTKWRMRPCYVPFISNKVAIDGF